MRTLLRSSVVALMLAVFLTAATAQAVVFVYIGPGGSVGNPTSGVLSDDANWSPAGAPLGDGTVSEELLFQNGATAGFGNYTATMDYGIMIVEKVTFDNADTTATSILNSAALGGDQLQLAGAAASITMSGAGASRIASNLELNLAANTAINCNGAGILEIAGVLSGSSGFTLTKTGATRLDLTNSANTFGGNIAISAGTVRAVSLGLGTGKQISFGSGTAELEYTGTTSVARDYGLSLPSGGKVTVANGATNLTLNGAVSGTTVTKAGPGTLTFGGAVALTGATHNVGSGTVAITNTAGTNDILGTYNVGASPNVLMVKENAMARSSGGYTPVSLAGGTLRITTGNAPAGGLVAGTSGSWNNTVGAANPANQGTVAYPVAADTGAFPPWADNTQWWYTGKINLPAGTSAFNEDIDDNTFLAIKVGATWVTVLNDTGWNNYTTGTVTVPTAGSYDIDLRMFNGGGGAGPINAVGVGVSRGNTGTYTRFNAASAGMFNPIGSAVVGSAVTLTASSEINLVDTTASFGALTIDNTGTPNITLTGSVSGDAMMASSSFTSTTVLAAGTFTLANAGDMALGFLSDSGANVIFDLTSTGNVLLDNTAASGALVAGSEIRRNGTGALVVVGAAGINPLGAASVSLGANRTVALSSKGGAWTANNPITTAGNATILAGRYASGVSGAPTTITLGGVAVNGGSTLTLGSSDNYVLDVAGAIGGGGSHVVMSGGSVRLSGVNTYSGNTTVNAGTLDASNISSGALTVARGATMRLRTAAQTVSSLSHAGSLVLGDPAGGGSNTALTVSGAGTSAINGTIANASATALGSLTAAAGATLEFRGVGNSTYSGGTTVAPGTTVRSYTGGSLGTGLVTLDNGLLHLNPAVTPGLVQGVITGTGSLNTTTSNPANRGFASEPYAGQTRKVADGGAVWPDGGGGSQWGDNETWVYTGTMYLPGASVSFQGDIDDNMRVKIDGNWIMPTSGTDNWHYGTGVVALAPSASGWHEVEFRFQNGGGGAGATHTENGFVAPTGGTFGTGFVYNTLGGVSNNRANNPGDMKPIDVGGALFRPYGSGGVHTYTNSLFLTATGINTVQVDGPTVLTGSITGPGGLTKTGMGALTVQGGGGPNAYAGPTNIDAGALMFNTAVANPANVITVSSLGTGGTLGTGGNVAGPINLNDMGRILVGTPTATAQVTYGGLFITPATAGATSVDFKLHMPAGPMGPVTWDQITPAALAVAPTGNPTIITLQDFGTVVPGVYTVINFAGATAPGDFAFPAPIYPVGDFDATLLQTPGTGWQVSLVPNPNVWTGALGDGMWGNPLAPTNWSKGVVPDNRNNANFTGVAPGPVSLAGTNRTIKGLYLNDAGAGGYTIAGPGNLVMNVGVGNAAIGVTGGPAPHTIAAGVQMNVDTDVTAAAGTTLNIVAGVSGARTMSLTGPGNINVVAAGSGNSNSNFVVNGGGARTLGVSGTNNTVTVTGTLTVNAPANLTADAGGTLRLSSAVTSVAGGSLTKVGAGRAILETTNTLAGGMTVQAGQLLAMRTTAMNGLPGNTVALQGGTLAVAQTASTAVPAGALLWRGYNDQHDNAHNWAMANYTAFANHFNSLTANAYSQTNGGGMTTLNWPTTDRITYLAQDYVRWDNYVARMTGFINIPAAGTYNFRSTSDDGSKVWIDRVGDGTGWTEAVSNLGWQGMTTRGGASVTFAAAGWYPIDTGHYEGGGGSGMIVEWDQGTGSWAQIPNSILGQADPAAVVNYGWNVAVSVANSGLALPDVPTTAAFGNLGIGGQTLAVTGAPGSTARFAGTATFSFTPTLNVGTGITLELANVADGGFGFSAQGAGTVYLSNPATLIGGVIDVAGGNVRTAAGGMMLVNNITASGANATIQGGPLTLPGPGTVTVAGGGKLTVSNNVFAGANAVTKAGGGTLALAGTNTMSGGLTVADGRVAALSSGALGGAANTVYLQATTLRLGDPDAKNALTFRGYNDRQNDANDWAMANYATFKSFFNGQPASYTSSTDVGGQTNLGFPNTEGNTYGMLGYARNDNYLARMTGYIKIPAPGTYNFRSTSDDGSKVWVDVAGNGTGWTQVVDNMGWQGMTTRGGTAATFAAAGWYPIDTGHYEGGGGAGMIVEWDQGSGSWAVVPNSILTTVDVAGSVNYGANVDVSVGTSTLEVWKETGVLGNLAIGAQTLQVNGLSGSTARFAGTATFSGAPIFNVASGVTLELADVADAGFGFSAQGAGTVYLSNAATSIGGVIDVSGGNLRLAAGGLNLANNITSNAGLAGTISGGPLNLAGSRTVTVAAGSDLSIQSVIPVGAGANKLTKDGAGTLVLPAGVANAYSAGTKVSQGSVFVGDNSSLGTGAVELAGGTLSLGVGFGLKGGRINGANWDTTTSAALLHTAAPSPPYAAGTVATYSGPVAANSTAGQSAMWPDNSTWVYSGQIWLDPTGITPGQVSFFRKFDDDSRLVIDGNIVFDGNQWNNQAYNVTGVSKGWHDFELRLGQGGGGVGPYDGWPFGFGVDSQGRGTTNSGDYVFPNGNAWFRTSGATSGLTLANNLTVTAESSLGGSTVEVPYHSATVTGSLNMGGGTAINPQLNVTGGGNRKVTISGPATTTSTGQPVYNVAANTTLELSGGYNDGGMGLSKSGNGTLLLSGGNALSVTGNTAVTAGKLVYDLSGTVTGVGSTLAITAGATVEAQNTADPFTLGTTHTAVNNDGSFSVLAGTKKVASISGTGTTTVNSSLVTGSIVQDTLVIGAGGSVTIAASVPFSGAAGANAVPEPGTILLTLLGGLCLGGWLWRRRAA